jgi:hypothetical protein
LTTAVDMRASIYDNKSAIDAVVEKIDVIYRQVKKNERAPATDYLTQGLDTRSNLERTIMKLETINGMGLIGTRK